MYMKLCNRSLKFKMSDYKAGPRACAKKTQILSRLFLTNHSRDCSEIIWFDIQEVFHDYINKFEYAVTHVFLVIFGKN